MKILEKEIGLRDETRAVEQAREALTQKDYEDRALPLAETQDELAERVAAIIEKISDLPEGRAKFAREIALLDRVEYVMHEARDLLSTPDTGPMTIAAETEVIELLLQARRINPKGGGGGGSTPGGGGTGDTKESALALLGDGSERNAQLSSRDVRQSTGVSGIQLPAEFRRGLDVFFSGLEQSTE